MKEYYKLVVHFTAYYSQQIYYEELYLTADMWYQVSNKEDLHVYLYRLDGKHSEARAEVEVDTVSEDYLKRTTRPMNTGEELIEGIYNMMSDKYSYEDISELQDAIKDLSEIEFLTIEIKKKDKDEVLELLNEYIV